MITYGAPLSSEDQGANAPLVVKRLNQQVATACQIFAIELLHASQAVDLR